MTKRAAILIAAGLVGTLVAGALALSSGRGIVRASTPAPRTVTKTETQVITITKRRPSRGPTVIVRRSPTGPASWTGDDSGFESESEGAGGDD
jgi:hypothetical protein